MKSVCVTKAKAYYIIADGYTECYTFNSREEAESFIELFKPALCPKDCDFLKKHQYLGKFFCLAYKDGEKELKRDIEGNAIMINGCAGEI